jgi:hypothetical protein
MWTQGPIWEPKDSNFRPYSITTLIVLYQEALWAAVSKARIGSGGSHNVVEEP